MDALLELFAQAQGWLFEALVQPALFSLGLAGFLEQGYSATGWFLVGLLQLVVMLLVLARLQSFDLNLEEAALDWFALGRVRSGAERVALDASVTGEQVRALFERLWAGPLSLAVTGRVGPGTLDKLRSALGRSAVPQEVAGATTGQAA